MQPILIAGSWRSANASSTFCAENPATKEPLPEEYPVSTWEDCEAALAAARSVALDATERAGLAGAAIGARLRGKRLAAIEAAVPRATQSE